MGFVKESKIHPSPKWADVSSTWATWSDKFPDTVIDSFSLFHQPTLWRNEEVFDSNTFAYMGRNTDNDVLIEEDDLHWENLTDYTWSKLLPRVNLNWEGETTNWELTWQEWRPDFETTGTPSSGDGIDDRTGLSLTASSLATLDGNWESKVQTDKTETVIDNQFFKYSWAGLNSTWDSLT